MTSDFGKYSINVADPASCIKAIKAGKKSSTIIVDKHDPLLDTDEFKLLHCYVTNKADSRGRGSINVLDGPKLNKLKNDELRASGKYRRNSKYTGENGMVVTYTKYHSHAVAMRATGVTVTENNHVSHLCHNALCCREKHLVVESGKYNNQRKGCPGWLVCITCKNNWSLCKHKPKCLSFTKFNCCDKSKTTISK